MVDKVDKIWMDGERSPGTSAKRPRATSTLHLRAGRLRRHSRVQRARWIERPSFVFASTWRGCSDPASSA